MTIYLRPLLWNIFVRPIRLVQYRNSLWKEYYGCKQIWNSKQEEKLAAKLDAAIDRLLAELDEINNPLSGESNGTNG